MNAVERREEQLEVMSRRAQAELGFITHALVYFLVITMLTVINVITSPGYYWVVWPLLGWGVGVLWHGVGVFVLCLDTAFNRFLNNHELHSRS